MITRCQRTLILISFFQSSNILRNNLLLKHCLKELWPRYYILKLFCSAHFNMLIVHEKVKTELVIY